MGWSWRLRQLWLCFSQEHMQTFCQPYPCQSAIYLRYWWPKRLRHLPSIQPSLSLYFTDCLWLLFDASEECSCKRWGDHLYLINGLRANLGPLSYLVTPLSLVLFFLNCTWPFMAAPGPLFGGCGLNLIMYFGMKFAYDQGYSSALLRHLLVLESEACSSIVMMGTIAWLCCCYILTSQLLNIAESWFRQRLMVPSLANLLFARLPCQYWWLRKEAQPTVVMLILVVVALVGVKLAPSTRSALLIFCKKTPVWRRKTNVDKVASSHKDHFWIRGFIRARSARNTKSPLWRILFALQLILPQHKGLFRSPAAKEGVAMAHMSIACAHKMVMQYHIVFYTKV